MAKSNQRLDNQSSLFDLVKTIQTDQHPRNNPGAFDLDRAFRESVSLALKNCPLSRWQVAARMSELSGCDITKSMLDSWTAESKEQHRFPAIYLPAFCEAVGSSSPMNLLARPVGVFVLPGPEALRAEIQRIEEDILKKQTEKRKRIMFLKEMEGEK